MFSGEENMKTQCQMTVYLKIHLKERGSNFLFISLLLLCARYKILPSLLHIFSSMTDTDFCLKECCISVIEIVRRRVVSKET